MDKIKIQNLEIFAHHGVLPEENVLGQKFLISLEIQTDTEAAGKTDDLTKTINYAQVCQKITSLVTEHTYKLIETVAEEIASLILMDYELAKKITVEVKKPWAPIMLPLEGVSVTITRSWHQVYLSLGSNMGDKKAHLEGAITMLKEREGIRLGKVSSFYVTKPVGGVEQDDFLNAAVEIQTLLSPQELLAFIGEIEKAGKRERLIHWGPRTIDVDILLYDQEIIETENLHIPHIEMTNRRFVLEPLNEIAPYALHPVTGHRVCELFSGIER